MTSWWKQRRIWLAALLPAALTALVLTTWHAHTRIAEIEARALDHTHSLARQLASVAEPDVASGNRARLQAAVRTARDHFPAITAASITHAGGEVLARAGREAGQDDRRSENGGNRVVIEQPIGAAPPAIGRFTLTVDLSAVRALQAAVLLESAGLGGLMLLLASVLAASIGAGTPAPPSIPRLFPRLTPASHNGRAESGAPGAIDATMARLRHDNRRLEQARRAAEAASERKSRYLAEVSHEIRNPMNAILGFTELLARDDHRLRRADYVATVRDSIRNLLGLLNGVLDLSKAEAGRMQIEYADTDINALLIEMHRLFAPQTFAKGVELVITPVDADAAAVRADAMRLKQVLVNLVSNAIRFTDCGHVRVSATADPQVNGRLKIRFRVEDSGCGIPEDVRPRLFEAFAQGPRSCGGPQAPALDAGTGLGLSIASELVGCMGGRIALESESGRGAAFSFTLELERAHGGGPAAPPPAPARKVVLIDPEVTTREPHAALLARAGFEARVLAGVDGIPEGSPAPDCEALVVHIPAADSAAGRVSPLDPGLTRANRPVIALACVHSSDLRQALSQAGYCGVIGKTADPGALREELERALTGGPEPSPDAAYSPVAATGRRLLIVDDCTVNLELLVQYASAAGFEPRTARSSDKALRQAASERFDAIVLDMRLPERDGAATADLIRRGDGPNARTPIIAVTADAFAEQASHAVRSGIDDVLIKPVTSDALVARLNAWMSNTGAEADAELRPVVDPAEATRRAGGKPDLARELFAVLCRNLPDSRRTLARARASGDARAVLGETHRLRGAVSYCGVPRLEAAVASLDQAARGRNARLLDEALARIDARIAEVLAHADRATAGGETPAARDPDSHAST